MKLRIACVLALVACDGPGGDPDASVIGDPDTGAAELVLMESVVLDFSTIDYDAVMVHHAAFGEQLSYPFSEFGDFVPGNSARPDGYQVQPTYHAPLGTAVLAPVSGRVVMVPTLYSGDFSIHIDGGGVVWETEHVIDVLVSEGDEVVAGQQIASVSDYECEYSRRMFGNDALCGLGIGIVELGVLDGSGVMPFHSCPFAPGRMSPDHQEAIFEEIEAAREAVETILGDPSYYDEETWESRGCVSLDPIEG